MEAIYALTILMAIFAFGEIVAKSTKAILSTTLVISLVLMISFWCGLPSDIFDRAGVSSMGMILVGLLITSLGTMMDFYELKRQWKTVLISLAGVVLGVALIIFAGQFLVGKNMALAGAPIFAGGNTAALIMTKAFSDKGIDALGVFCILMLVTQNFVGIPIASVLLRKEAKLFISKPENIALYADAVEVSDSDTAGKKTRKPLQLPASFDRPSVILTKLGLIACVSFFLSGLTGGKVHYFVVALLLGVLFCELGFLDKNILNKSDSGGFIIFATTVVIFSSLAKTTPAMLASMIIPLAVCLALGTIGVGIAGIVAGRILKVSPYLAITIGLTCTFGFPTTMLMPKEVAGAIGTDKAEQEAIVNYLTPNLITAGFVTVTIASVIIAGVVVAMI